MFEIFFRCNFSPTLLTRDNVVLNWSIKVNTTLVPWIMIFTDIDNIDVNIDNPYQYKLLYLNWDNHFITEEFFIP